MAEAIRRPVLPRSTAQSPAVSTIDLLGVLSAVPEQV